MSSVFLQNYKKNNKFIYNTSKIQHFYNKLKKILTKLQKSLTFEILCFTELYNYFNLYEKTNDYDACVCKF